MFGDNPTEDLSDLMADQSGGAHEQLWVDKYAPKSFTDLLSDEQTNRQVTEDNSYTLLCILINKCID